MTSSFTLFFTENLIPTASLSIETNHIPVTRQATGNTGSKMTGRDVHSLGKGMDGLNRAALVDGRKHLDAVVAPHTASTETVYFTVASY